MARLNVNPTRMELTRLKKKLETARRGHKLLKDKQDELMRRFLELVEVNKRLRQEMERAVKTINVHMSYAASSMRKEAIEVALMLPKQEVLLDVDEKNIMSVRVPVYTPKFKVKDEDDIYPYGYAYTSADLDGAVKKLKEIFPDLLELAQVEKSCQLMAAEIEKTRRRVNALEHIMIPDYVETIKYIAMKLDENERSTTTRLMKMKDMMLKDAGYGAKEA